MQRSGDTDYKDKIGVWLQLSHKLLAEIYDYWFDLQDKYNFNATSGTEDYPLPNNFDKPFRLYDIDNNKKMTIKTEEEYFDDNIANIIDVTKGKPDTARIYGTVGSRVSIATTGDTVKVKSSYATEPTAVIVRIEGYIDSSLLILGYESITIPVSASTTYVAGTTTFYKITHISKSINTTGYITIANSAETVLETLASNERVSRHKVLKLGLIPNATIAMRLLYKKNAIEMVNDYDYPFTDCSRYLIMDAVGWAQKQSGEDQKAEFTWNKANEALKVLLSGQNNKLGPDYVNKLTSIWSQAHRV